MKRPQTVKRTRLRAKRAREAKDRTFPSLANAAAALNISPETLKAAKRAGCPAFSGRGSVKERLLLDWIRDNPDFSKGTVSIKGQIDLEVLRRHRRNNDVAEAKLIPRAIVNSTIATTFSAVCRLLDQRLENEYPALVVGLDIPNIRVKGKQLNDEIRAEWRKLCEAWPE